MIGITARIILQYLVSKSSAPNSTDWLPLIDRLQSLIPYQRTAELSSRLRVCYGLSSEQRLCSYPWSKGCVHLSMSSSAELSRSKRREKCSGSEAHGMVGSQIPILSDISTEWQAAHILLGETTKPDSQDVVLVIIVLLAQGSHPLFFVCLTRRSCTLCFFFKLIFRWVLLQQAHRRLPYHPRKKAVLISLWENESEEHYYPWYTAPSLPHFFSCTEITLGKNERNSVPMFSV